MKLTTVPQHYLLTSLAIALLLIVLYSSYSNNPDVKNNLLLLSKQASSLNLQINQSIYFHQYGSTKSYDHLTNLAIKLEHNQQHFNKLKKEIQTLDEPSIIQSITLLEQQLSKKIQLLEAFKSHISIYNSSLAFFQTLLREVSSNPVINAPIKTNLYQLQSALYQHFFQPSVASTALINRLIVNLQSQVSGSQPINKQQLTLLLKHAQLLLDYGHKTKALVTQITVPKTDFIAAQLEARIALYLSIVDKKTQAMQNILLFISLFAVSYISFLLLHLSRQSKN